jgi:membrane-associated protease RseP (regulator of RpoE activity)
MNPEPDTIDAIVARYFRVDEMTFGDPKQGYYLRYRGELLIDSVEAYDRMAEALRIRNLTPLFRLEDGRQTVLLVRSLPQPKPSQVWVNVVLFFLTVVSVLFAGTSMATFSTPLPSDDMGKIAFLMTHLAAGWPFAVSLLAILLAHEFGHYFVGRARGAAVTLPYFIPFPFSPIGTMGAAIQMKSIPKNKRALFDLAVAGPLAGLVVAVPILLLGLHLSTLDTITKVPGGFIEGNSLLYILAKYITFGKLLPLPANTIGVPLLLHWISYFFIGIPVPVGGTDVYIGQVAWAGWVGLLVTFLNLIPAGQLDGGHIIYAVFGRNVRKAVPVILIVTFIMGFFWNGWWLWTLLIFLLGRSYAEPLDQITQLDTRRKLLAALMLVVFLLVLTPIPFIPF